MKKWSIYVVLVIQTALIHSNSYAQQLTLLKKTTLSHYPSSSAIEFYKNQLYVIGDDAPLMLLLDTAHNIVDSTVLFKTANGRISKDEKADIEAISVIHKDDKDYLLAISSFSTPTRNSLLFIPLSDIQKVELHNSKYLINDLNKGGINAPNIEGLALVNDRIVMSNRANNSAPSNHLIIRKGSMKIGRAKRRHIHSVQLPVSKAVIGISGLTYMEENDMLLFTASTEETNDAYADGAIGESYLGYISRFSKKYRSKTIAADGLIPITVILRSGLQKIESVCVESYLNGEIIMHLASDNDNGQSTLFKMSLRF